MIKLILNHHKFIERHFPPELLLYSKTAQQLNLKLSQAEVKRRHKSSFMFFLTSNNKMIVAEL